MMKYKIGQTIILNDRYRLIIEQINEDTVDFSLWDENGAYCFEDCGIPESTIDAIIAHHNRR